MNPEVAAAMKKIATSPELRETLGKATDKSIVSFVVEFGGNIAAVASVDKVLGFVTKLQNFTNVNRYGRWGLPPADPAP
jgi:hypothetical protein